MKHEPSKITRKLIEFSFLPGVGSTALRKITSAIGAGLKVEEWDYGEVSARFARQSNRVAEQSPSSSADRLLEECEKDSQVILSALDDEYPAPLRHITDFPPLLYFKGEARALNTGSIAVVGTREVSRIGASWARQISRLLSHEDLCTVSGLALGVDTAAHEGAIAGNGRTVAVLAHGLDRVTPASNRDLARQIIEAGGALVAEHPPRTPPRKPEYVRRNRLQSGMSVASIVVESGEVGGSIYQGRFTHEQGRTLFCVKPPAQLEESKEFRYGGAELLIRDYHAKSLSESAELTSFIRNGMFSNALERLRKTPWDLSFPQDNRLL